MSLAKAQLERMARGHPPGDGGSPALALIADRWRAGRRANNYRAWRTG